MNISEDERLYFAAELGDATGVVMALANGANPSYVKVITYPIYILAGLLSKELTLCRAIGLYLGGLLG